jgi:hypothetical protein
MFLRRFEDKDDRVRRRLALTLDDGAPEFDVLLQKLKARDVPATLEGWSKDKIDSMRHLTLSVRLAPDDGEQALIAILETEPGIVRAQLDPA